MSSLQLASRLTNFKFWLLFSSSANRFFVELTQADNHESGELSTNRQKAKRNGFCLFSMQKRDQLFPILMLVALTQ